MCTCSILNLRSTCTLAPEVWSRASPGNVTCKHSIFGFGGASLPHTTLTESLMRVSLSQQHHNIPWVDRTTGKQSWLAWLQVEMGDMVYLVKFLIWRFGGPKKITKFNSANIKSRSTVRLAIQIPGILCTVPVLQHTLYTP